MKNLESKIKHEFNKHQNWIDQKLIDDLEKLFIREVGLFQFWLKTHEMLLEDICMEHYGRKYASWEELYSIYEDIINNK